MTDPLKQAIREAERTNKALAMLLYRWLGTKEHPRGRVLSAYRQARRAMRQAYREEGTARRVAALEVLRELRETLRDIVGGSINDAVELGVHSAQEQVRQYEEAGIVVPVAMEMADRWMLEQGWWDTTDGRLSAIRALIGTDAEEEILLGDDGRLGVLQPAPVQRDGGWWIPYAVGLAWSVWIGKGAEYDRQAVAVLDKRTTDCCRQVDGQVVKMNEPFHLTGVPRYADNMMSPPFHDWCRTSVALIAKEG